MVVQYRTKQVCVFCVMVLLTIINVCAQIPYKKSNDEINLKDFNGSLYLEDIFIGGTVYDGLTKKEKQVFLRYDVYNDVFEMKDTQADKKYNFLKRSVEVKVLLNGKNFYFLNYTNNEGKLVSGYLDELAQISDIKLYVKYDKTLILPKKAQTSLETDRPGKIKDKMYYVVGKSENLKATTITKKSILTYIPEAQKKEVKEYIKKSRIKFKDPKDIKKIAEYYKTLE
ncbi:hypothetical protein [Aquimarina sp. 2201CG5-10]|uniref:hypothetical protein n=1 Tax=Aquimarina callyspongiae TaxID=3098150 RepID=UPI002AB577F6|nr:hypothetical protein [Aquimarina sp. 2201CG5-10]MDY8134850.1 hypothetical protein [Aquimarina sp. 2201CG5-10]